MPAIDIARTSQPMTGTIATQDAMLEGKQVAVAADDYGRDAVCGLLVGSSEHHLSIRREDPRAGEVVVHFPRIGFSPPKLI